MNHLCVSTCEAIKAWALKGWSGRRIARELGMNRETVARHLGLSKRAIPPHGSGPPQESNPAIPAAGSHAGRRSLCDAHRTEITVSIVQPKSGS